jgi:hypothetical protein
MKLDNLSHHPKKTSQSSEIVTTNQNSSSSSSSNNNNNKLFQTQSNLQPCDSQAMKLHSFPTTTHKLLIPIPIPISISILKLTNEEMVQIREILCCFHQSNFHL